MKTRLTWIIQLAGAMILSATGAESQGMKDRAAAYWVIEGNINTRDYTLIHYYNDKDELVGEERLEGRLLDITKKRNVKFLNMKLRAWARPDTVAEKQPARKAKRKNI